MHVRVLSEVAEHAQELTLHVIDCLLEILALILGLNRFEYMDTMIDMYVECKQDTVNGSSIEGRKEAECVDVDDDIDNNDKEISTIMI